MMEISSNLRYENYLLMCSHKAESSLATLLLSSIFNRTLVFKVFLNLKVHNFTLGFLYTEFLQGYAIRQFFLLSAT